MEKRICDICKKNDAGTAFKIQKSHKEDFTKGIGIRFRWSNMWSPWEELDICDECGEKLLGVSFKSSSDRIDELLSNLHKAE